MTGDEKKWALGFITPGISELPDSRTSTLGMALWDYRIILGYNPTTNVKNQQAVNYGEFSPYSYPLFSVQMTLTIMDMIGSIFKNRQSTKNEKGIISCLKDFSKLDDKDIRTLNALRNCLAHDYSLINIPENKKYDNMSCHAFEINMDDEEESLIKYPKVKWVRSNYPVKQDEYTIVSAYRLKILIDTLIKKLGDEIENDQVLWKEEFDEIRNRYSLQ